MRKLKITIETDSSMSEDDIIIKCKTADENIKRAVEYFKSFIPKCGIVFYKDSKEVYLKLDEVLFFESSDNRIYANTKNDAYIVKSKLYILEEILPDNFQRISKSCIVNINHIFSIDKTFASSKCICFSQTYKQVYISRNYFQDIKRALNQK